MQQRDAFLTEIHEAARRDPNIVLLSCDFGAPALDQFRQELPAQFIHAGISEQNAVNVAVGLALAGKKPYLYWMAPFFLRCFEQLKLAAMHQVPITVVSVGAGLSYAGAGPTHYATEDIACYRTLVGTEVYTASTANLAAAIARHSVAHNGMLVARLERGDTPELYETGHKLTDGFAVHGEGTPFIACGYLVSWLRKRGHSVIDLYRVKPTPMMLVSKLDEYDYVHTFDEQYKEGGIGSAVVELLSDYGKKTRVFRRALPDRPIYENGTREELLAELV